MKNMEKKEKIDKASDVVLSIIAILVVAFFVVGIISLINWFNQPNEFVGTSNLKDVSYSSTGGLVSTRTVKLSFDDGVIVEYKGDLAHDGYRIGASYEIWYTHNSYYAKEANNQK